MMRQLPLPRLVLSFERFLITFSLVDKLYLAYSVWKSYRVLGILFSEEMCYRSTIYHKSSVIWSP